MTSERRFEQELPSLLADLLAAPFPDYRDDVLAMTAGTRQRPAWTFPERWLPMELVTTRVPTTRMPWRLLGVVALIAILLSMAVAAYIGSRTLRLPPPFGPAANGQIAIARNGDLYTVDPQTGRETLVVGGPQQDDWVGFTPDGTHGSFIRWGPQNGAMTAARVGTVQLAGGAEQAFIKKDVLHGGEPIEIAPNGRDLVFSTFDFGMPNIHINLAALDGSSFRTFEDVPVADYGGLAFLAPDGREVVYLARSTNGHTHDIRALDVTSGETPAIVETTVAGDIFGNVSAAPDGKRIAYALRSATGEVRVHVMGTDGTGTRSSATRPGRRSKLGRNGIPNGAASSSSVTPAMAWSIR